jgi:hypothetical protein
VQATVGSAKRCKQLLEVLNSASNCWTVLSSTSDCWTALSSASDCWTALSSASDCWTVLDSASESRTMPDSARERDMNTMSNITLYNFSDVTVTNYGNFLSLLMHASRLALILSF